MRKYSKQLISSYAKGVYTILISVHGLANTKKILVEINRMTKAETKRRKEEK